MIYIILKRITDHHGHDIGDEARRKNIIIANNLKIPYSVYIGVAHSLQDSLYDIVKLSAEALCQSKKR